MMGVEKRRVVVVEINKSIRGCFRVDNTQKVNILSKGQTSGR